MRVLGVVLAAVAVLVAALRPDRFLSAATLQSMGFQLPELGLLSLAMMLTMLTGGIDLSIVATSNLAGIVAALVLPWCIAVSGLTSAAPAATGLVLAVGLSAALLVGLTNGCLIGIAGVSPILATLGTMTLVEGLALVLSGGRALSGLPETVAPLGNGMIFGVPVPLAIFAAGAIVAALLLEQTPWGLRLYMMGANPTATRFAGVSNRRLIVTTYVLASFFAGVSGLIMMSRFNSAKAGYGQSYLLVTILAAVLGGTSPHGGFGRVGGLVLALFILQVSSSGLNLLRVDPHFTVAFWGATTLVVMAVRRGRSGGSLSNRSG